MAFKALKEWPYCVVVTTEDEKGSDLLEQCRNEEQNEKNSRSQILGSGCWNQPTVPCLPFCHQSWFSANSSQMTSSKFCIKRKQPKDHNSEQKWLVAEAYVETSVFQLTTTFFLTKLQLSVSEKDVLQAKEVYMEKSGERTPSYQISHRQDMFKLWCHRMVLHCHEQSI